MVLSTRLRKRSIHLTSHLLTQSRTEWSWYAVLAVPEPARPIFYQTQTRIYGNDAGHDAMECRHEYKNPRTTVTIKAVGNWKRIHKLIFIETKLRLYELSRASKSAIKFVLSVNFSFLFSSSCWNHLTYHDCIKWPPYIFGIQHIRIGSINSFAPILRQSTTCSIFQADLLRYMSSHGHFVEVGKPEVS